MSYDPYDDDEIEQRPGFPCVRDMLLCLFALLLFVFAAVMAQ